MISAECQVILILTIPFMDCIGLRKGLVPSWWSTWVSTTFPLAKGGYFLWQRLLQATPLAAHTKTPQLKHSAWDRRSIWTTYSTTSGSWRSTVKSPSSPFSREMPTVTGAPAIAAFLKKQGYKRLAVSTVDEALPIVRKVRDVSILLLTPPLPDQLDLVCKYRLTPTVCTGKLIPSAHCESAKAKGQRTSVGAQD